ncbi:MAG: winged helix-turn-helix domain-containing protein [Pyrinomonadaceae bacterium]
MSGEDFHGFEFGEFRLDPRRRSLSKNGQPVAVTARNFDLLLFLVENDGRILAHDELLDKVWAGTFVEQATLKKGISALRQVLGEATDAEYIKTIPRRGYSFVSPVQQVTMGASAVLVRESEQVIIIDQYEEISDQPTDLGRSAADLARALPAANRKTVGVPRWMIFAGVAILFLGALGLGLLNYLNRPRAQHFSAESVRISRITNSGRLGVGAAISPDGNYIVYPAVEKAGVALWVRQVLANSTSRLLPPTSGTFWAFAFAPDNSFVYYVFHHETDTAQNGLFKVPFLGGEPQRLMPDASTVAVAPDGQHLATVRLGPITDLVTLDINGANEHTIRSFSADYRLWNLVWTPDGRGLLCTMRRSDGERTLYYVTEVSASDGSENVILPEQERVVYGATWLPDRSALLLVVREPNADLRQLWEYTPGSRQWRRVTNDDNSYKLITLTRDGNTILTTQESRPAAIWLAELPATGPMSSGAPVKPESFRQITDGVTNFDRIGWMADGRIMYSATDNAKEIVFTIRSDGSNLRMLTNGDDGIWILPTVGGNGQNVCFLSSRSQMKQVWRVDADGKNPTQLTNSPTPVVTAVLLKDNATVIYTSVRSGKTYLFRQNPGGKTDQLTESDAGTWAVSPDEKFLAAVTQDSGGNYRIELLSLEDGKSLKTFPYALDRQLSFTPDGKALAYDAIINEVGQIMIQPLEGGAPFALTAFTTDLIFGFGWSADGKQLAMIRGKQLVDAVTIRNDTRQQVGGN